jgi:hypothetical protein
MSRLGRQISFLITTVLSGALHSAALAQTGLAIGNADTNGDGYVDRAELIAHHLRGKPVPVSQADQALAESYADDVLTTYCTPICERLRTDEWTELEQDAARRQAEAERGKRGLFGLTFAREVTDAPNPRGDKFKGPFILSYVHDEEPDEGVSKDQISILGGVRYPLLGHDLGNGLTVTVQPGIDADAPGGKGPEERSLTLGVPIGLTWTPDLRFLESLTLGVTPKFNTDWPFERRVYEMSLSLSPTSAPLAIGFVRPPRILRNGRMPWASGVWQPSVSLELGDVADPGKNEDLIALEGSYSRVAPRAQVTLYPTFLSYRLRLTWDGTRRFDLDGWDHRDLMETRLSYDLLLNGTAQFSIMHRRGYKPPAFARINQVVVGFGFQL